MTNYIFDHDHEQYMSLAPQEDFIPESLRQRALAALKELEEVKKEFERIGTLYDAMVLEREEHFSDAMSHFQETKDDWVRVEDEHGNVHWVDIGYVSKHEVRQDWVDASYMAPHKTEHSWPFGDLAWTY
ncbi:UNVERIFIED_CONTAM: hypothetical protein RF648_19450 [Kocuria sp. CPCC 205274]